MKEMMGRYLFSLALVAVGTSCGGDSAGNQDAPESPQIREASIDVGAAVHSDTLRTMLAGLSRALGPFEAWRQRAMNVLRADSGTARADSLFLQLRLEAVAEMRRLAPVFHDSEFQSLIYPGGAAWSVLRREQGKPLTEKDSLEAARADTIIEYLRDRGIWFYRAEGDAYFEVREADLLAWFGEMISSEMREFLTIWAREQEQPVVDDGATMVSPDELGERIVAAERFLERYPASPVRDPVATRYHWYFWIYLGGLPNTPAFDRRSGVLVTDLRNSYEQHVVRNESTNSARVVRDYLRLLESSNFRQSPAIDDFLRARADSFDTLLIRY